MTIKYLHTMVRVKNLEKSQAFFELLGLKETRRYDNDAARFTLVFMWFSWPRRDRRIARLS